MGVGKRRRQEFLKRNPLCCFCGGETLATTLDHIPARAFFIARAWPESYVFPACQKCNSVSKNAESITSALVKVVRINDSPYPDKDIETALYTLKQGAPTFFRNVIASEDARNYFVREKGAEPTSPAYRPDSAVVTVPDALGELTQAYFQKLALALFYKHIERPAPKCSHVFVGQVGNKMILEGGVPPAVEKMFPTRVELRRGAPIVEGQFDYSWGVNTDEGLFGCFVVFGDSIGAICAIREGEPVTEKLDWRSLQTVHEDFERVSRLKQGL